jgi:hypothetical protein
MFQSHSHLGYDGAPVANVGTVSNQGFEVALGYQDNEGEFTVVSGWQYVFCAK